MYQKDRSVFVTENHLSKYLCGKSRPGHFQGVCTVVAKLFNIVEPDVAYFGRKDYQQALIIQQMVRDLNFPVRIKVLPIVREKGGLALSSRNAYLSPSGAQAARCLYQALLLANALISQGERQAKVIIRRMIHLLKAEESVRIDYVAIVDPQNLLPLPRMSAKVLIALAVYIGGVRLIDNRIIDVRNKKN